MSSLAPSLLGVFVILCNYMQVVGDFRRVSRSGARDDVIFSAIFTPRVRCVRVRVSICVFFFFALNTLGRMYRVQRVRRGVALTR